MTEGLEKFQNYIGGSFVDASDERTFDSLDPYAGQPWASIPEGSVEDIDHAVAAARSAFDGDWGRMTGFQRAACIRRLADLIGENARSEEHTSELQSQFHLVCRLLLEK